MKTCYCKMFLELLVIFALSNIIYILIGFTDTLGPKTGGLLVGTESSKLYFPHIASGGDWETEICLINTASDQNLSGTLKAYDDLGREASESISVDLAPHARKEITIGDEFTDAGNIGYMIFETDSDSVVGYTKFYILGQYRVSVPAVSEVNTNDIYISHIASDENWWTGMSLVNTTSSSKQLTIEFNNGETKTKTLAAGEHQAFTIKSLFDGQPRPNIHSAVIKDGNGIIGLELFASGNLLSGILLKDDTATNIYYPHVASDTSWWTGIVAYNPSGSSCDLTITPFSSDGTPLSSQTISLGGFENIVCTVQDLNFPESTAWFRIYATSPITGFELFGTQDGNQFAGYTGVGISATEGVFAKLETDGWTGVAFVNIEDSSAAVTLTAYNDSGNAVATKTISLDAHAKIVGVPASIFSQDITSATYISYFSDKEVVGFQLNGSPDGMMLDALPGSIGNDGDAVATYTASGTYTYDPGTGTLTLNTTSSDFECEGPEIGTEQITVSSITSTTMVWEEDPAEEMWTRDSGISGDIVGIWESYDDDSGNSWEATFELNGSFSVVGSIVQCENGNGGEMSTICTPYINETDMTRIVPFSSSDNCPWGRAHGGISFHATGNLKPFQAVCSGMVNKVMLLQNNINWQVNVRITFNSTYAVKYAFKPMTNLQSDGETQLANISVLDGQSVSQGDIIGYLYTAHEEYAHVYFCLHKNLDAICPEPYFTPEARDSILNLIHKDNPDWNMCY